MAEAYGAGSYRTFGDTRRRSSWEGRTARELRDTAATTLDSLTPAEIEELGRPELEAALKEHDLTWSHNDHDGGIAAVTKLSWVHSAPDAERQVQAARAIGRLPPSK